MFCRSRPSHQTSAIEAFIGRCHRRAVADISISSDFALAGMAAASRAIAATLNASRLWFCHRAGLATLARGFFIGRCASGVRTCR